VKTFPGAARCVCDEGRTNNHQEQWEWGCLASKALETFLRTSFNALLCFVFVRTVDRNDQVCFSRRFPFPPGFSNISSYIAVIFMCDRPTTLIQ
jgi:hypothetical protein